MDGRVTCPAKPEHGDDQGKARDDAKLETFFGLWGVGSNFLGVALVSRFDDGEETMKIAMVSGWVEKRERKRRNAYKRTEMQPPEKKPKNARPSSPVLNPWFCTNYKRSAESAWEVLLLI